MGRLTRKQNEALNRYLLGELNPGDPVAEWTAARMLRQSGFSAELASAGPARPDPRLTIRNEELTWHYLMHRLKPYRDAAGFAVGVKLVALTVTCCPGPLMELGNRLATEVVGIRPRIPGSSVTECLFVKDQNDKSPFVPDRFTVTVPKG